jgi:hypothetical protein
LTFLSQIPKILTEYVGKYVDVVHILLEKIIVFFGDLQVSLKYKLILFYLFQDMQEGLIEIGRVEFEIVVFTTVEHLRKSLLKLFPQILNAKFILLCDIT